MALTPHDTAWMERALALAASTVALASPNPQVGCVLVKDGQAIGEGAHLYDRRDHAEIVALKQAAARGADAAGATAYVTLEPCSHHGRTGPCADALIAARIARVVVATVDPNPQVGGQGIARLRAAGIEVTVGVLEQQARDVNDAFCCFIRRGTPLVTLKAALSAEGCLAPPTSSRAASQPQPYWITGREARAEVQQLRHASDAVLTGIGTVLADDPALTDRSGLPRRRPLLRVILDTHLRLPPDSQLVRSANRDLLVLCGPSAAADARETLRAKGVEVRSIPTGDGRLSLPAVLEVLAERKILSVLLECGSMLNGAFLRERFVDKVILFYAHTELGPCALPFAEGIASPHDLEATLQRVTRAQFSADTCVSGTLRDPWPAP